MNYKVLDEVRKLYKTNRYDDALNVLADYERVQDLSAEMLLLKGRLIQLSESGSRPLSEAKRCFMDALRQDKDNINALLELGWLYTNVLGDRDAGRACFAEVIEKCAYFVEDANRGLENAAEHE
jgi:Tfp pilus assembly protein PilF